MALVPIIAWKYSYNTLSAAASGVGFIILLAAARFLRAYEARMSQHKNSALVNSAMRLGMLLGLFWIVEISINNFVAPPASVRDLIDNVFWALIALSIFVFAISCAYRMARITTGIEVGIWSGFVGGSLACCMALSVIVFGMRFVTHDPLNIAEWAVRETNSHAPTMAAYFAFETFAGAFLRLIVLGIAMGGLLGIVGGTIGKGARLAGRLIRRT
jgi:hypothetical protein